MLDPGHTAARPGALSVRGIPEVQYNDELVAMLAEGLKAAGFEVRTTRAPGEESDLGMRAAVADAQASWLFLSIHHDSAQLQFLSREQRDGKDVYRTLQPIRGYSLFVSGLNVRYPASLQAAQALGRRLRALGRAPTLHHAEPIPGEGRPLLDPGLGIYRFDELGVLKQVACPAVLLEVGVLVDETDEAYVSSPANREALVGAIVQALKDLPPTEAQGR